MLPWTGRDGASAELRGYNVSSALRALGWRTTIANGRSGMLADSVEEWADAISHLLDNPEARTAMAEAGLETYNSNLTTAAVARKLDPILRASMRPRRATPG